MSEAIGAAEAMQPASQYAERLRLVLAALLTSLIVSIMAAAYGAAWEAYLPGENPDALSYPLAAGVAGRLTWALFYLNSQLSLLNWLAVCFLAYFSFLVLGRWFENGYFWVGRHGCDPCGEIWAEFLAPVIGYCLVGYTRIAALEYFYPVKYKLHPKHLSVSASIFIELCILFLALVLA